MCVCVCVCVCNRGKKSSGQVYLNFYLSCCKITLDIQGNKTLNCISCVCVCVCLCVCK